jgi:MFS-type transporter involved in bile tolerance (Atg22 family)
MRGFRILAYGIRQNIRTAASIHRNYKKGLSKYLLATMFAQAGVAALTSTSVVYLSTEVGLNATDTLIFFLVVLIGTIPGTKLASLISKRVNPSTSWQLSMLSLFIAIVIGAFTLGDAASKYLSLVWGFIVGIVLGWFYPTENLFFSCILPKGQEAEIAGFRVYCSTILSWVPPLIFSALVENEIDPKWGMTFMGSFILIAALLLKFAAGTWEEILKESGRTNLSVSGDLSLMGGLSVGGDLPEREAAAGPPL